MVVCENKCVFFKKKYLPFMHTKNDKLKCISLMFFNLDITIVIDFSGLLLNLVSLCSTPYLNKVFVLCNMSFSFTWIAVGYWFDFRVQHLGFNREINLDFFHWDKSFFLRLTYAFSFLNLCKRRSGPYNTSSSIHQKS